MNGHGRRGGSVLMARLAAATIWAGAAHGSASAAVWRGEPYKGPADPEPFTYGFSPSGRWRSCRMGGGGYIQNVVLSPTDPGRVYAYVDVGGLYRSDDGGLRWRMLHGNWPARAGAYGVRGVLVDPRDADRLVAAVGDNWGRTVGVLTSSDGGASWRKTLEVPFWGNGDYRWSGTILARHPLERRSLLAASVEEGVWRSTDGGETWTASGAKHLYPTDLRYDRAEPERVWLCAQHTKAWWPKGREGEWKELEWPAGLFRSDDGGSTWEKLPGPVPEETMQDPVDAGLLYGIIEKSPHVSRDAGETWARFSDGLPARAGGGGPSEDEFQSLAAGPDFVLTASTKGTFYRLNSGETTWRKIEREGIEEVYEGETWFRHASGGFGSALGSIVVDPRDPGHWFFTDWYAIYQTHDGGANWKLTIDGIEVTVLHCLQQDPSDPGVVHLGMADNGYFFSEGGGERFHNVGWRKGISNNVKCISLSPRLPARLYATGPREWHWEANQVFVSVDRGRSWTRSPMRGLPDMKQHHCNSIACDPRDPYTVYLTVSQDVKPGGGGVYRSTDGGRSWNWMGEGLARHGSAFTHSIWMVGREIAVGAGGGLVSIDRDHGAVYRYDAAADTWVAAGRRFPGQPNCVVADPFTADGFVLAAGGLFRSDDGGRQWRQILERTVDHVTVDLARRGRLLAGTSDGVMLSSDGGSTWRMLDGKLPYRVGNLVAFAGDRVIAGSGGSGAFWTALTPQSARSVKARPARAARVPGVRGTAPVLRNGSMTDGGASPSGWHKWTGKGNLELSRDTTVFRKGPASLRLAAVGGTADGSASQTLEGAAGEFVVRGFFRCKGAVGMLLVAVQVFDGEGRQVAWLHVADGREARDWREFSQKVSVPAEAATVNLVMAFGGGGKAWLDEVALEPAESVFIER